MTNSSGIEEKYNYLYNGHSDIVSLVKSNGEVRVSYYYDAFGNVINKDLKNQGEISNPFGYSGYQYDEETKTYYLNARMYDPQYARFLQEDTYRGKANDPLSLNLYTYVHNNPIRYFDPSGHSAVTIADDNSGSSSYRTKNLKRGSRGSEVRALQRRLGIKVDGSFGKGTRAAVMAFQRANGLKVDGLVGPNTLKALYGRKPSNDKKADNTSGGGSGSSISDTIKREAPVFTVPTDNFANSYADSTIVISGNEGDAPIGGGGAILHFISGLLDDGSRKNNSWNSLKPEVKHHKMERKISEMFIKRFSVGHKLPELPGTSVQERDWSDNGTFFPLPEERDLSDGLHAFTYHEKELSDYVLSAEGMSGAPR